MQTKITTLPFQEPLYIADYDECYCITLSVAAPQEVHNQNAGAVAHYDASSASYAAPDNPFALPMFFERIAAQLDDRVLKSFRIIGTVVPCGRESVAEGAVSGVYFVARLARAASNEAVSVIKIKFMT